MLFRSILILPHLRQRSIGSPVQLWTLSAFGINDDVRGCDACSGCDTEYEIDNLFNNRQSSARTQSIRIKNKKDETTVIYSLYRFTEINIRM